VSAARPRIVCLVGPTASGKSALGLALAERLDGEIVSADSRQVYRRLDVGTAKPTPAERARVAHHALDLVEPSAPFDVARFRAVADDAVRGIVARGRLPIVVGGTGLWIRVLLHGLCPAPPRHPALRAALEREVALHGAPALHGALAREDPDTAARVAPHDRVRIVRALEVVRASGVPLSAWQRAHGFADAPYEALVLGLAWPTDVLDARIAARVDAMVAAGFVDEVQALRAAGVPPDAPALRAVGYPELWAALDGRTTVAAACAATVLATRRFAKRQRTWFRREPGIRWYHPERGGPALVTAAAAFAAGDATPAAAR
jgi:tRNA dimethylallyltransferase